MRASVVIVTHNHRTQVPRCLDAVLYSIGTDDDIVVVDNASTDGTPDIIARDYPGVRLVRSVHNLGFGAGCNLGARHSRAPYLVFLNPDTAPRHGWLDALLRALESRPRAGLATPKLLLSRQPDRIDAFGHALHVSGIATCLGWGFPAAQYATLEEVAAVSGACFAIPRTVFDELSGFDERLFLYYEDDDLSLRARFAGYQCVAVPDAEVLHDHIPGFSPSKFGYIERNRWWCLLKLYRPSTLLALLPLLMAAEALAWGMAFRLGPRHVLAKIQAWVDLVRWLPSLPAARRSFVRRTNDRDLLRLHNTRVSFAQVAEGPLVAFAESLTARGFQLGRKLVSL